MKVALLSESPADEAALHVVAEGVLRQPVELIQPPLRARGWPSVIQVLPLVLRHLHFRTDTAGVIVVADADDTVVHDATHEQPGYHHPGCRLCQLRAVLRHTLKHLPATADRPRLHSAVGLAVPAIEAWYLCGHDTTVGEEGWRRGQAAGAPPYTRRELKQRVYGTIHPPLPFEIARAVEEMRRHRGDFRRLEFDFPGGFGALAADLRKWAQPGGPSPGDRGAVP